MITTLDVVVDGRLLSGSQSAQLRAGTVVVPLDPYVRAFVTTAQVDGRRITLVRNGRTLVLQLGSRRGYAGTAAITLPIAPYLRAGATFIPLAAAARALGASVVYDGATRTVQLATPPAPLTTFSPARADVPARGMPTFAPTATPAPEPTISGIPKPRRTPIPIDPPEPS